MNQNNREESEENYDICNMLNGRQNKGNRFRLNTQINEPSNGLGPDPEKWQDEPDESEL
jgi:hypothetical protein